jgi:integrase
MRAYTLAELDALEAELGAAYGPLVPFAAARGLRPQECATLERADIDRERRLVQVHRTRKTVGSARQVPLSPRAMAALERVPPRFDTRLLFTSPSGGPLDLGNFRRREWTAAVESFGIAKPARIYDLRSTFAANALAAGVTVFELARVMGTSVRMIERHYGRYWTAPMRGSPDGWTRSRPHSSKPGWRRTTRSDERRWNVGACLERGVRETDRQ